ncbi:MAG: hypothetical protein IJY42_06165 [Clostridia bacterium]|nr:hypothetical protein [Clostridia bacterium]
MKRCFIINPRAGKGLLAQSLKERVEQSCARNEVKFDIFMPESPEDSAAYIRRMSEERDGEVAFFACGGDGTLCETVNGLMKLPNREGIAVGLMPIGTGNDFVRNFEHSELFLEPDAQLDATVYEMDLIRCNECYAVNMINIGFDSEVVAKKEELSGKKWLPSKLAYVAGLVLCLAKKPGVTMDLARDEGSYQNKKMLLTTVANGNFCGGGFHSNPKASLFDGCLDCIEVKDVTRLQFLKLVGSYKKGTHLREKFSHIIDHVKSERIHMVLSKPMNVRIDGELKKLK